MAVTKVTYASDSDLAITLTGPLTTGAFRSSAVFDNRTTTNYMDIMVGGMIGSAGTSWVAGDSVDIYLMPQYSATSTDIGGALNADFTAGDGAQTADTDFVLANCQLMKSISPQDTTPATNEDLHWSVGSIAQYNGGVCPAYFSILIHNNATGSIDSGNINVIGITYTTV
jgi:hypothetical protein